MLRKYITLMILALFMSFSLSAELRRVQLSDQDRQEIREKRQKAAELALQYFSKNPKELQHHISQRQFKVFAQAVKKKQINRLLENLENPVMRIRYSRRNSEKSVFQHPVEGLIEMGYSMMESSKRENVFDTYSNLYRSVPKKLKKMLEDPQNLQRANMRRLKKAQSKIDHLIAKYKDLILEKRSLPPSVGINPFNRETSNETGHMPSSGVEGDRASQCNVSKYHPKGLISQVPLARNQKLTSIKNQNSRGTCVAFAIAATAETEKILNGYSASNFSEQSLYGWIMVKNGKDYEDDGLTMGEALDKMKDESFNIGYESLWQYNQSNNRNDFDEDEGIYPLSCQNYSPLCSRQAMQLAGGDDIWIGHFADEGPYVNDYTSFRSWDVPRSIEMNRLIALDPPAIVSITTDEIFRGSVWRNNGYLDWDANHSDKKKGGHAMMYVGYVRNDDVPDGIRDAKGGGYVVLKNSYGTGASDCGFYYMDDKYVEERMKTIYTISI